MLAAASHGPSALWYATRGAGAVTLVLLTASVVLGIGEVRRWRPLGAPRFAVASLHRTFSLLALVLLAIHIATTLLDAFPHIALANAAVPFATDYRPLWMGLGTLASDVVLALVLTSLVRRRLGYRAWRGLHWFAYGCWPLAVLHGLGSGSDTRATWMLVLTLGCVAAVVAALANRVAAGEVGLRARGATLSAVGLSGVGLAVWLAQGPLAHGWAARAGTPASVLAAFGQTSRPVAAATPATVPDPLAQAFSATASGAIHNGVGSDGTSVVDLDMRLAGGPPGVLRIRLGGRPLAGGGLRMDRSAVTLGPPGEPARYSGRIQFLRNQVLRALVGSADGRAVRLTVQLSLGNGTVAGQVTGTPTSPAAGA